MFWLRNKKINYQLHIPIWRPDLEPRNDANIIFLLGCDYDKSNLKTCFKCDSMPASVSKFLLTK